MMVCKKSRYQLTGLLLLAFVLMQLFCPAGLLALQTPGQASLPHSGCHGSMPQTPDTPLTPHRCCVGGSVFKAAPSVRYVAPVLQIAWHEIENESAPAASFGSSFLQATDFLPPGFSILRI